MREQRCIWGSMLRKSAGFFLILATALATLAGGIYLYAGLPAALVCNAARNVATLPDDLKYTGGFIDGRNRSVFTHYELQQKDIASPEALAYLTRLQAALAAKGVQLVFLLVPPRAAVIGHLLPESSFDPAALAHNFDLRLEALRSTGMIMPNALASLRAAAGSTYYLRDTHWTPLGASMVAEAVAVAVNGAVPSAEDYSTRTGEAVPHNGNYSFPLNKVCGTPILSEPLERQETVSSAPAGLLDDAMPPITLVGTSFSNRSGQDLFNFAGALKQAFQQDVLNEAVDGGGFGTAILHYLDSPAFRQHPPQTLIWESISEMSQNQPLLYRQAIPAVEGNCKRLITVSEGMLELHGPLMVLPREAGISGSDYYLRIILEDKSLLQFSVMLDYADGQSEAFNINRSNRVSNNGRYFIELSNQYNAPLTGVRLNQGKGAFNVTLCQY